VKAWIVLGLGFGDEGKGSVTDFLTRKHDAKTVVRYSGGAQCGHNVCLADGRHHTFAQFGSGSFVPGVVTFLSRHMLVNPGALLNEGEHLQSLGLSDIFQRMVVDRDALVTNPFQVAANRIREISRGDGRHGSCGMGIGETRADALAGHEIFVRDLENPQVLSRKLEESRVRKRAEVRELVDFGTCSDALAATWTTICDPGVVRKIVERYGQFIHSGVRIRDEGYLRDRMAQAPAVFEGAQGVLLDQDHGFQPYTTWSDTTFNQADTILKGCGVDVVRVGVIRAYATRHGAGPLPTEDPELVLEDEHNGYGDWQREFRVGHFDSVLFDYALQVCGGVDMLAITHLDRVRALPTHAGMRRIKVCTQYQTGQEFHRRLVKNRPRFAHDPVTVEKQTAATKLLQGVTPVYQHCKTDLDLINIISERAGRNRPVKTILSYGPTSEDKR